MPQPLFRAEALSHQNDRLHGEALAARLPRVRTLVMLACFVPVVLGAFVVWGQFTRKEHVSGYLVPSAGLIKVVTPQAGTVARSEVREGQAVHHGDVLLVLSGERSSATAREAQASAMHEMQQRRDSLQRERAKQADIDTLSATSLAQRIRGLEEQSAQAQAQLELQRHRVAAAERTVQRHETLAAASFISDAGVQQKQEELLDQRGQLATLMRNIASTASELAAARNELAASALKRTNNAEAIQRQISELEQQLAEAEQRRSVVITAPADGTVTTILTEVGQLAAPGSTLLSILPTGAALQAQLLLPTRAAGFVQAGQTVALRYQAFPYQRFGHQMGKVVLVGRSVIQPNELNLPQAVQEPVYRMTVSLPAQAVVAYGREMPLQAGMAIDADIWVDRRSILEWIVDPLLAVTGKV
jgi:membrane fusion protein